MTDLANYLIVLLVLFGRSGVPTTAGTVREDPANAPSTVDVGESSSVPAPYEIGIAL